MFASGHFGRYVIFMLIMFFLGSSAVPHSAGHSGHPKEHHPVQNTGEYKCK